MVVVLTTSIIALIIAYFHKMIKIKPLFLSLFALAFVLLTFLQAIHYNYGADYMGYYAYYQSYQGKSLSELKNLYALGSGAFKDIGWVVLNRLMPGEHGFFLLVIFISIIENLIYFKFITTYIEQEHWWKALAIYLFMTSYYVLNFSALRQGLTVSLCVLCVMLSSRGRLKASLILAAFTITIHMSAIVIIPVLFLSRLRLKNGKKYGIIIFISAIVLFFGNALVGNIFDLVIDKIPILGSHYGHYTEDIATDNSLGFGFVLHSVMYLVMIYHVITRFDEYNHEQKVIILLTCISFCIIPFQLRISGLISRIGYYFSVFQIVSVPMVYSKIHNPLVRYAVWFIYIFMMLYGYYNFFFVTQWSSESFSEFHTIFSVL